MSFENLDNTTISSPETLESGEIEAEPYIVDFTAEQAETLSGEETESEPIEEIQESSTIMIPASQYGWSQDYELPEGYNHFVLSSKYIVYFDEGTAKYNQDGRVIFEAVNGKYINAYNTFSFSGIKFINIGDIKLSTIDITGNGAYETFTANYSIGSADQPGENPSDETNQGNSNVTIDLNPVIEQLKGMEQLQTETLKKLEQIYNNDTYMNLSICICLGLIIGQILLLGFWRARRRG